MVRPIKYTPKIILDAMVKSKSMSAHTIANKIGCEKRTVIRNIPELEKKGHVRRIEVTVARQKVVGCVLLITFDEMMAMQKAKEKANKRRILMANLMYKGNIKQIFQKLTREETKVRKGKVTSSELHEKPPEPHVQKSKSKPSPKKKEPLKSPVIKKSTDNDIVENRGKERGKELDKYIVLDLPDDELEFPSKMHIVQSGNSATSREMAENAVYGLNQLDKVINHSYDRNTLKMLNDKMRKLLLFLRYNSDVAQYVSIRG
jgi:DNA-binding Lrp family transcriptional regulator